MMGRPRREPVGPDVWATCRELIPAGSVFAFLAEHRDALFPEAMFADMYPSSDGRPSVPPGVLACMVVLQTLHGLSDIETVQELRCDLRWKAACGLCLHDPAFHSVVAGEADRFRMQRDRLTRGDVPADDGLGPVVDDRHRSPAEVRERPAAAVEERLQVLADGEAAERIAGLRECHVEGVDLRDAQVGENLALIPQSTWAWAPGITSNRRCILASSSGVIPSSSAILGRAV